MYKDIKYLIIYYFIMVDHIIKTSFSVLFGIGSTYFIFLFFKNITDNSNEQIILQNENIIKQNELVIEQNIEIIKQHEKILLQLHTINDSLFYNNKLITDQYDNIQSTLLKLIIDSPSSPSPSKENITITDNDVEHEGYDMIPCSNTTKITNNNKVFGFF